MMKYVTAALLVKNNLILIAKRKSNDPLANKWEFPGGTIEDNETPEQCLKREMKEEFNINISVSEFLGENIFHYDHGSIKLLVYRSHWQNGEISSTAHDDFRWITPDKLGDFDFAPADIPFVDRLRRGEIEL